jgi:hypothetical protein
MIMCPDKNNQDTLEDIVTTIVKEVATWLAAHDREFQNNVNACLELELERILYMLLCDGGKSRDNLIVLRQGVFEAVCSKSKDLFCGVLMWLTKSENIESVITYMTGSQFCNLRPQGRLPDLKTRPSQRKRRQYDLVTIYTVYVGIFCSPAKKLKAIFGNNDPDTLQGLSAEMKFVYCNTQIEGAYLLCC